MNAEERYKNDPIFHSIVDSLYHMLDVGNGMYTPTELREAVILATSMWESIHIKPIFINRHDLA